MSDPTPEMQKVRAIDVRPYRWGIWCTVGDNPKPFTNAIESRRWSDDGQTIWFMLGTHNYHNARPDEELTLVPMEESRYVDYSREEAEHAQFLAERPTHAAKCEACGGAGRVPVSTTNLRTSDLPLARTERGRLQAALRDCAIDEDNPDTCGVCGQHFTECDADQRVRGEATEAACAGARARETLRPRTGKEPER